MNFLRSLFLAALVAAPVLADPAPVVRDVAGTVIGRARIIRFPNGTVTNSSGTFTVNLSTSGVSLSSPTIASGTAGYITALDSSQRLIADPDGWKWDTSGNCYTMGHGSVCEGFLDYRTNNPAVNQIRIANSNSTGQARILYYNDVGTNAYFGQSGSNIGNFFQNQTLMDASGNAAFIVNGGTHSWTNSDLAVITAGKTLRIATGTNAKHGTFTLSSGARFVANTSITANSVIIPTIKTVSGTATTITVSSTTVGGGFNVTGGASDNSTYNYAILESW